MAINKCSNCGCEDSFLTSPAPCPTPAACPDPEPCYTVTGAQCTIYTGPAIECGTDTVVATDTNIADALNDVVTYFCQELNQVKLRYVKEFTSNLDGTTLTITQTELAACGITPSICSLSGTEYSDFILNIWYLDGGTTWRLVQPYSINGTWSASVNDSTGEITILFDQTPIDPPARVRAVLIF